MARQMIDQEPRTVYTSACGRLVVERHAPRDFWVMLDGMFCGAHQYQFQAEEAARTVLAEALDVEAIANADDAADIDALIAEIMAEVPGVSEAQARDLIARYDATADTSAPACYVEYKAGDVDLMVCGADDIALGINGDAVAISRADLLALRELLNLPDVRTLLGV